MSDKLHVNLLAKLCAFYGLRKVVISPGSRSAPITIAFHHQPEIDCYVVPDERSAAYFAIGIAQYLNEPVGIICTSGTAALNFTPAIAEAYYQKIPILAITADRPPEWLDQIDGQTINQTDIYKNFVSYQAQLPVDLFSQNEQWHIERMIRDGFLHLKTKSLPVHFNVPIREPLYGFNEQTTSNALNSKFTSIDFPETVTNSSLEIFNDLTKFKKILIVLGMKLPHSELLKIIGKLSENQRIVIFAELLSNVEDSMVFKTSDALFSSIHNKHISSLEPDLVISFCDILLSKPLKQWIRSLKSCEHWIVGETDKAPDVFQKIDKIVYCKPEVFLNGLLIHSKNLNPEFYSVWEKTNSSFISTHLNVIQNLEWSDLQVFQILSKNIPEDSIVHLGNSSPVRYANFFNWKNDVAFYCNRGTAGIDGCSSTAIGMASQTDKIVTLITGDISFLYDSNALWNKFKKPNFKLIVINNNGGNIFSLIPGPDQTGLLEEYFLTNIPVSIEYLCNAYGINYLYATNENETIASLSKLYSLEGCSLLEIKTDWKINTKVWNEYFKQTKN